MTQDKTLAKLSIYAYMRCAKCLDLWKAGAFPGQAMKDATDLSFGVTQAGFQLWCNRHNCNVLHLDLLGQKVEARTSTIEAQPEGDKR